MFKTKAGQLDKALKALGSSVTLSVNHADNLTTSGGKPRKGSFVVTSNGVVMCELLNMARPFKSLREMDIDALAEKIVKG